MPPSRGRALWDRYARHVTVASVALVLGGGALLVVNYWRRKQSELARVELARALAAGEGNQVEYLQRLASAYAATDASPEIRYRLGCVLLKAEKFDAAVTVLRQLAEDAPDTRWGAWAAEAAGRAAEEEVLRARALERLKSLREGSQAQRRFSISPPDVNPRDAVLSIPRRPGAASEAPAALDPSRFGGIERP